MKDDPFDKVLPRKHPTTGKRSPAAYSSPVRSSSYLQFIRAKTCCHCCAPPRSDPHHVGGIPEGKAIATKVDDLRCVPLCRKCHDYVEEHRYLWIWSGPVVERQRERHTEHELLRLMVELLIEFYREQRIVKAA